VDYPIISADSHIVEPRGTYDRIDVKFRDRAPRIEYIPGKGDCYIVEGFKDPIVIISIAAAGKKPEEIVETGECMWDSLHRGGWDPAYRLADQERDGIAAEIIYPTMGMAVCNAADYDLKHAVFRAYNYWIAEYCAFSPVRMIGAGQTAMRTPDDGIKDLENMKKLGLRTAMLPAYPQMEDYDSKIYDEFWAASISLGIPISFHVLTGGRNNFVSERGPRINSLMGIIRTNQDLIAMLIYGGVFERHPKLRTVSVEGDAGWVPHYMYRMDHQFNRHRHRMAPDVILSKAPSDYFRENVYLTFQDDWIAFKNVNQLNWRRLMWANDFPHADSTWPWSQGMLKEHSQDLSEEQKYAILCGNVAELYGIDIPTLTNELRKKKAA